MSTQDDSAPWGEESDGFESVEKELGPIADEGSKVTQIASRKKDVGRSMAIRLENKDIVKRAKALYAAGFFDMPDVKYRGNVFEVLNTDTNKFKFLDMMFSGDIPKPHLDEYKGRIVDHRGRIIDDRYPVVDWLDMFRAGMMKGLSAFDVRRTLKEWALNRSWNDLIERVQTRIPAWDGVARMESYLITLFEPIETPLLRNISQYFWLSLYMRVMIPGSQAPIVLSLFGAQNCGKSWFGTRLARIITGDDKADSVQLDLGADKVNFLREITGNSVVAAVGEMTGFNRGDLNKIKDFVTRSSDKLHYKFEGHFDQPRQWVTIMDGNQYEGLQRDSTGNRRFMPMFCGQLPDEAGQPVWDLEFTKGPFIASQQFEDDVWQLLAEAAHWYENNGDEAYSQFVSATAKKVFAFSAHEMANDRGTITDDDLDIFLVPTLKNCSKTMYRTKQGAEGVAIYTSDIKRYFMDNSGGRLRPVWKHLTNKMLALGGNKFMFTGGYAGFLFTQFKSIDDFIERIGVKEWKNGEAFGAVYDDKRDAHGGF